MPYGRLSLRHFAGVLVMTGLVGCGGPAKPAPAPVSGKVVTKQGKECDGALVVFHPSAPGRSADAKPVGTTSTDGSFSLTSFETGDGALPGDYGVTIVWPGSTKTKSAQIALSSEGGGGGADQLAGRYGDPRNPRIRISVPKEGLPDLRLEVE
jgi:hypothetical protein